VIHTHARTLLLAALPITAIVGTGDAARCYMEIKPQGMLLACLVIGTATDRPTQLISGPSGDADGILQVTCLAPKHADAWALAKLAAAALDGKETAGTLFTVDDSTDIESMPAEGMQTPKLYGVAITLSWIQTTD
jgi:hypothetical protein